MNTSTLHRRQIILAGATASTLGSAAFAQSFPTKPVRILVGSAPGGAVDIFTRAIAPSLQESLGQAVVVENRTGANGNAAADAVAKSAADGYTLVANASGFETINPLILPKASFDASKDLQPVASLGFIQLYLVTKLALEPKNIKDFIAYAKKNVGKLSFGSAGTGSTLHLAAELFKQNAGIFATHIPYRGAALALQDLLGGQIDFCFDPGISFPHVRNGKLNMLAVASRRRSALFPNVPTLFESGVKGVESDTMFGLWAPTSVPTDVVTKIHREVNKSLARPDVAERFRTIGGVPTPISISDFKAKIQIESAIFGSVIRARNIKGD